MNKYTGRAPIIPNPEIEIHDSALSSYPWASRKTIAEPLGATQILHKPHEYEHNTDSKNSISRFGIIWMALGALWQLHAAPVTIQDAQNVARNWMEARSGHARSVRSSNPLSRGTLAQEAAPAYRIVHLDPQGWVIVAGDDRIDPILAYGESKLRMHSLPPAMRTWLRQTDTTLKAHFQRKETTPQGSLGLARTSKWAHLRQPTGSFASAKQTKLSLSNTTKPLLWLGGEREEEGIRWSQEQYYNAQCPKDTISVDDSHRALVGCVAVAMGQVMRYYAAKDEPAIGRGSYSYNITRPKFQHDYGWQVADFGATTYDWENMPKHLDEHSSETEVSATSTLLYHVGVSVGMDYGNGLTDAGSQSYYHDPEGGPAGDKAMKSYFGFTQPIWKNKLDCYSDKKWETLLKTSIYEGNPVLYGGLVPSGNGGHAFVLDGYIGSLFHVNWGWNGEGNGYFSLNILSYENQGDFSCCPQAIFPKGISGESACDTASGHYQDGDNDDLGGGCTYNPHRHGMDVFMVLMVLMAMLYPLGRKYVR